MGEHDIDRSILSRIEASGGKAPRVRLRDAPEPGGPAERRYEIRGEIGHTPVARVLHGRDVDIGRSVVLKVLDEEHLADPEILQRFVTEAQIAGQLQHPGVLPVFELGLLEERRPFFAVRHVKGGTLADRLAARERPEEGRSRLLGIFHDVARAMAYVHSRGVIHRGLMPRNILVGRFGEVQITDWGIAMVLAQGGVTDERRARRKEPVTRIAAARPAGNVGERGGTVLGNPPYMPPEQALGQVEDLDERSDVFALGAILTEILTGDPPYVGDRTEVRRVAAAGEIGPAIERLEAAGAESDIVELARACLSPLPSGRPRDATRVAATVGRHLATVEERRRRFEVEAAGLKADAARAEREATEQRAEAERVRRRAEEARRRADRQRRGKHQTLILFSCVALLLVVGAVVVAVLSAERRARTAGAVRSVETLSAKAAAHARASRWEQAFAEARSAEVHAGEAGEESRRRVRDLLAGLDRDRSAETAETARREKDSGMLSRLERSFLQRAVSFDLEALDAALVLAYRDYGIDLEKLEPAEAASRIRESRIREELAAALDHWAALRSLVGGWQEGTPWRPLVRTAALADDDSDRSLIRESLLTGDRNRVEAFAREARVEDLSLPTLKMVGLLLGRDPMRRADFLRRAQILHPDDLELNVDLARALTAVRPAKTVEALRHARVALALAPEKGSIWALYGFQLQLLGRSDEAVFAYRRSLTLDTGFYWVYGVLARTLRLRGEQQEADAIVRRQIGILDKEIEERPGDWSARLFLVRAHASLGDLDEAAAAASAAPALSVRDRAGSAILLGTVARGRRDHDLAAGYFRAALAAGFKADLRTAHYGLGATYMETGRFREAAAQFQAAEETAPNARLWTAVCEKLAEFEEALPEILAGRRKPRSVPETQLFARLCFYTGHFAAAVPHYGNVLEAEAAAIRDTPFLGNRYQAGRAAAWAAARRGEGAADLTPEAARALRGRALEWLGPILSAREAQLHVVTLLPGAVPDLPLPLSFVVERDLGALREDPARTEEEQREWAEFFGEIEKLTAR